ncbi:DJ-1 family glyoxalase III [Thiomicrorhabdus sp.]|uniref:DJ-1 family glyoxalase III n=1 Tax=Thiomicrorhabdus sp. TaxID=2039724 RepID=UPI0029C768A9|nr:DJ-1 family glyoxalase III [Thiomicrorhabdus sp.]
MANVLIPLAQGCEELEAVTLIDLLVRAGVEVITASLDDERIITASRGVQLIAQTTLDQVLGQEFDLVVLPGGLPGADYLNEDPRIIELLKRTVQQGGLSAAICAAPKVLVSAGLLDNRSATSFPGVIDENPAPGMQYLDQPVVDAGSVLTSKGPGTAMEFALVLIERLCGAEKRLEVESALQRA